MRRRYRQVELADGTHRLVEIGADASCCDAPTVRGDIAEYQSIVTGETIRGRAAHREHLKQHGCEEIGSERPAWMKENDYRLRHGEEPLRQPTPDLGGAVWEDPDMSRLI